MTDAAVVETDAGPVRGAVTDDHRLFQGIPYAASTVGDGRWRPPRPVPPWTRVRDATRPGPMCPQQPSTYAEVASLAEDCLCLNVTVPRAAGPQLLRPVMVWIHGDGAIGAGSFFDARRLADVGDVLVVTVNYRLGIFGAFGHPGLEDSGTFGLQDQQAALRWVARNAAAFGGDTGNVTLFGESYGGLSVSAHLVAPGSAGLFHRAIIQSGCADAATAPACLRALPAQELLADAQPFQPYGFGNRVLPDVPAQALRDGRFQRVPVVSGGTRDEHRPVRRPVPGAGRATGHRPAVSQPAHRGLRRGCRPGAGPLCPVGLPVAEPGLGDGAHRPDVGPFHLPATPAAVPACVGLRLRVRRPAGADVPAVPDDLPPGAFHAAEVPYLFRDPQFQAASTPDQRRLSDQMLRYWANFARAGDPNDADLPPWPPFDAARPVPHVQSLAPGPDGIGAIDYAAEHQLDFWSGLP